MDKAPSAAASGESVIVEKKIPNAATPSMEAPTYRTVTAVRQVAS
jgi:hypothetical protein